MDDFLTNDNARNKKIQKNCITNRKHKKNALPKMDDAIKAVSRANKNIKYHHENRIKSTYSNVVRNKKNKIVLFTDSILKIIRMGELNCHVNGGKVHLKSFPGSKAKQLNHHTIPILEEHQYDAAAIHVGINDLLKGMSNNVTVTVDSICNDIFGIALRCRNHNIDEVFISSVAYSSKVSHELIMQQLNDLLYKGCIEYGYNFIDNGAVSTTDIWTD